MSSKKSSSIDLESVRYFTGVVPSNGVFSIEMKSTDLSADTTWNLQFSSGGTNFDNAQESGTDVSGTLVASTTTYEAFYGVPGDYIKVVFAGETTGNVAYVINAV